MFELSSDLKPFAYSWPGPTDAGLWQDLGDHWYRSLNESEDSLKNDSRWPAFFPSPIAIVTVKTPEGLQIEKVVGPAIVNRFPYIAMLSFCHAELSARHYARAGILEGISRAGEISIQFLRPGPGLKKILDTIAGFPGDDRHDELKKLGGTCRLVERDGYFEFAEAFLVYRGKLVPPLKDFDGEKIFSSPFLKVGSHTLCFFEIEEILLDHKIANCADRINWRSLPEWKNFTPKFQEQTILSPSKAIKGYSSYYQFPSSNTVSFEFDEVRHEMAVKRLSRLPTSTQVVDNDKARWPCFFPSSVGLVTLDNGNSAPSLMPCGSTTMVARSPLTIAICVSYAKINARYAPRASLAELRRSGRFGCGVPYVNPEIENAIRYCGNVSVKDDPEKALKVGMTWAKGKNESYRPEQLPVFFECDIVGEHRLGTHFMFLGEVKGIYVNKSVSRENPLEWFPFAAVESVS